MARKVLVIAAVTNTIAFIAAVVSWTYILWASKEPPPTKPLVSATLLLCLFLGTVSIYQIFISSLMIVQEIRRKNRIFTSVLWYITHINLVILSGIFMTFRVVACAIYGQISEAVLMALFELFYLGTFLYFLIVINHHIDEIDEERYY